MAFCVLPLLLLALRRLAVISAGALGRRTLADSSRNGQAGWAASRRDCLISTRTIPGPRTASCSGCFPDRLKLSRETIVGKENLEKAMKEMTSRRDNERVPTIKLDDRDLQAAILDGVDCGACL